MPTLKPMMAFSPRLEREERAADCEIWAKEEKVVLVRPVEKSREIEEVVV